MNQGPEQRRRVMVHGLTPVRKAATVARPSTMPYLIGHGYDIHRLQKATGGAKLILAGVEVSDEVAPIAHSDGDVILHAIVDAMLGALGMGDIGELFSDADPKHKGAASSVFVQEVLGRAQRAGYRVGNVDVSLLLEQPKIASFKPQMIANLRRLLDPVGNANVKAGTNEECDSIGKGKAVAAHALVLLVASG